MLDPYFFQSPPGIEAPSADSGLTLKVIGYSASGAYTLVVFAYGDDLEYSTIECLYRDRIALAAESGAIPLGISRSSDPGRGKAESITLDGIELQAEQDRNPYNIPRSVAVALTAPGNYRSFLP